jgi:hypothetical protein
MGLKFGVVSESECYIYVLDWLGDEFENELQFFDTLHAYMLLLALKLANMTTDDVKLQESNVHLSPFSPLEV